MTTIPVQYIAGWKTVDDWRTFRDGLRGSRGEWTRAYEEYFLTRLRLRYLEPIGLLQRELHYQGEGFSILAIQCTLIEFLEATFRGLAYRYLRRGETCGPFEYSKSAELFADFLCTRAPFATRFDRPLAEDFYRDVRCGLLHEAQTKGGWRVWGRSSDLQIVDPKVRIVFRDDVQDALQACIDEYGRQLPADVGLQQAFLRKFDSLCA
jgi:hypothetical protein